ncbi:hypothetical protein [Nonlabens sp.]|uniref:hypothetical protein n=1 Tax=Nonlabens sp. TaxID=1888209 RepID=UPI003266DADB
MIKRFEKYRPEYSVKNIGIKRYILGIVYGIGSSIVLFILFGLFTQLSHVSIRYHDDFSMTIIHDQFTNYYFVLMGLTVSSMGFLFCNQIWLGFTNKIRTVKRRQRHAQNLVFYVVFLVLMFLTRMTTIFVGLDIKLYEDFQISSYLLPLYLFLYSWIIVSGVFKIKKQFFFSLLGFVILGFLLSIVKIQI